MPRQEITTVLIEETIVGTSPTPNEIVLLSIPNDGDAVRLSILFRARDDSTPADSYIYSGEGIAYKASGNVGASIVALGEADLPVGLDLNFNGDGDDLVLSFVTDLTLRVKIRLEIEKLD